MQHIYHLVCFPESWMKANEIYASNDKARWRAFKIQNRKAYSDWIAAGNLRGTFTDKQKLIDILTAKQDVYSIFEAYYEYALIETHVLDCIDGYVFDPTNQFESSEQWFKFDSKQSRYVPISRPECLKGVCGFA